MAIQGLTPDMHDLASSRAFCLLCPHLVTYSAFPLEDDSPDDVCELVQATQCQERFRESDNLGPAGLATAEGSQETAWFPTAPPCFDSRIVPHTLPLIDQLCRLTC
jgi:hypothetical protein